MTIIDAAAPILTRELHTRIGSCVYAGTLLCYCPARRLGVNRGVAKLSWVSRIALLLFAAIALPGATSAASAPTPPRSFIARLFAAPATIAGLPLAATGAIAPGLLGGPGVLNGGTPTESVSSAPDASTRFTGATEAVTYDIAPAVSRTPVTVFQSAQVVSVYGHPEVPIMGLLGKHTPAAAAAEASRLAVEWDALNGSRGAVGALHLIVDVAQPWPMADSSYIERMSTERIEAYMAAARNAGVLLFLDLQLGMSDPLTEVQRLTPFLVDALVHVALDPEFAMRASRGVPGQTIGSLDAAEVNAVQDYLDDLVRTYRLPAKVLVLHQFRTDMLTSTSALRDVPGVTRIIDMDGWGGAEAKLSQYEAYSLASYSQRPAIKIFYEWDVPLLTPARLLALPHVPDLIIYQ